MGKGFGTEKAKKGKQYHQVNSMTLEALLKLTVEEAFKWMVCTLSARHTITSFQEDINIWYNSNIQSQVSLAVEHKRRGDFKVALNTYSQLFQKMPTVAALYSSAYKVLAPAGKLEQAERSVQINALLLSFEYAFTGSPVSLADDIFTIIPENPYNCLAFWSIKDPNVVNHLGAITMIRQGKLTKQSAQAYLNSIQGRLPIDGYPDREILESEGKKALIQFPWHVITTVETPNHFADWLRDLATLLSDELHNLSPANTSEDKERQKSYLMAKILGLSKSVTERISKPGKVSLADTEKDYPSLMIPLFMNIILSTSDIQVVNPLLQANIDKLDDKFATIWCDFVTANLSEMESVKAQSTAATIALFSMLMQKFTLGTKANNLEIAIAGYEAIATVFTRKVSPEAWAALQNNFGDAYYDRIKGDPSENLEQSICFYKVALNVYTQEAFPEEWASIQNSLGSVFSCRIKGNPVKNLDRAIRCYLNALQVYTQESFPEEWASIQNNLASACLRLNRGDRNLNFNLAIAALEAALKVYTRKAFPEEWAMTKLNLASAYNQIQQIQGDNAPNLKQAVTACQDAMLIYTQQAFPQRWATAQTILGNAYSQQNCIDEARACYRSALEIYTFTANPVECLRTGRNLGNMACAVGRWAEAIEGYGVAIEAVETSRTWATSESRRQTILAEAIDVYENMVQACINAGQLEKAIEIVERSRSKRLVDLMASNDLYQGGEISPEVKELLQQFDDLQQRIDQERSQNDSGNNREMGVGSRTSDRASFQAKTQAIASLEAEKQQIWQQLRRLDPVLAGEIQVIAPDFSAMQKLIDQPTTAILSFYSTSNNTHIFVLRKNQIACHTCAGQGIETLQNWIFQKWLKLYVEEENTWESQISNFLVELAERLQINDLISQHLQDIAELILVPHLVLHQIPFAALPLGEDKYLGDKFLIRYTPSCQVLEFCQQRGEVERNLTYGTVEDATEDLPFANFEGEQIAKIYNIPESDRLRGRSQATTSNYRQMASRVQVLHSSHHAESCLDNPLNSQLKLADGNITLGQLMTPGWRLPNLSDVFLSCCETGLGVPEITDDILTLSTGFLCAGARSVVSTLWSVDDLATALFSIFYYQYRQIDKSRPESLRQAQIKLRELKKDELLKREDIQKLKRQAAAGLEEATSKRKQYQIGSEARLKWTHEFIKYGKLKGQIDTLENSQDECPFSHPRFWAAFTCQGLR